MDRRKVYDKYKGHCSYCGNVIEFKDMQVDHIIPVYRGCYRVTVPDKDLNNISNLNPSCRRCNHYKRGYSLEDFRVLILTLHERLVEDYITKVAIDYGIVEIIPFDGKFYFEKISETIKVKENESQ